MCFEVGAIKVIVITKLEIFSNIQSLASIIFIVSNAVNDCKHHKKVIAFV